MNSDTWRKSKKSWILSKEPHLQPKCPVFNHVMTTKCIQIQKDNPKSFRFYSKSHMFQPNCPVFYQKHHTSSQTALCCIKIVITQAKMPCIFFQKSHNPSQNALCSIKRALTQAKMPRVVSKEPCLQPKCRVLCDTLITDNKVCSDTKRKSKASFGNLQRLKRKRVLPRALTARSRIDVYVCIYIYIYVHTLCISIWIYMQRLKRKKVPPPVLNARSEFICMYVVEKYVCTYINVRTNTCVYMCR